MVLCVGLNSTDTPCSPGPGSTLKVPLGNGTAMLRPEAENTRADLADGPPGSKSGSPYLCCLPRSASWRRARSFVCSRPQSTQNQMIPRPAVTSCPRPYLHLGWPLEYAGDSKPVARGFRGTVYSPRFNMSGSLAMFDATRLASSIVICFASRASAPRSNGHRRMPRQNRLRPSLHSLRKICRRAMGEAGGESFDHLVGAQHG